MMERKFILVVSALLVFAMIILPSCQSEEEIDSTLKDHSDEAVTVTDSNKREDLFLPDIKYDGYRFRILATNSAAMGNSASSGSYYWSDFGYNEERSGEPINDAVYSRNIAVEERLDITISVTEVAQVKTQAEKLIMSGEDAYDIIMPFIDQTFAMAQAGYLVNLFDVENINLDKPWWDQIIKKDLALATRLYVTTGEISMEDEEMTGCLMFSKDMVNSFGLNDPYKLVLDYKWTMDKMREMCGEVTFDVNGDGVLNRLDSFGYGNDFSTIVYIWQSSGEHFAVVGSDGIPKITINGKRSMDTIEKAISFINDNSCVIRASDIKDVANAWDEFNVMLHDSRLLFRAGNIYNVKQQRNMVDDFGIIPTPMFDDSQENYSITVRSHSCPGISIPVTSSDTGRTGVILETLAYESDTVRSAYYDITLTGKIARDIETEKMLDIIFSARTYDIGKVFGWGDFNGLMVKTAKNNGNFASEYASVAQSAEKQLDESYALFVEGILK